MRESEFKIEWLFSNLRWFFFLAVAGAVGLRAAIYDQSFPAPVVTLLIVGTIANLLVMILLLLNTFRSPIPLLPSILDIALCFGLIVITGGTDSPLLFVTLIPIITTALRNTWISSSAITICLVILYWVLAWYTHHFNSNMTLQEILIQMLPYITNGLILLIAGTAIGQVGAKIRFSLTEEQTRQEEENRSALAAAHTRTRLIFELASTLSATLNYERVIEAVLDVSNNGLEQFTLRNIPQVGLILLFGFDHTLYVKSARGLTPQEHRLRFPGQTGALAQAVEGADPILIDEPGSDSELSRMVAMHHCRQAIIVPLRAGFESYGVLVLGSPEPNTYTPDFQDLLVAVCNQAVMALQNARLYQDLMEDKEKLVAVEEDARKKLARDLHDGPTQTIAAIAMRLNYVRMLLNRDPAKAPEELQQLEDLARKTTKEIRQMLFTLRPLILETQGLVPALEQYIQKLAETDPTPITLESRDNVDEVLDKEAQGALFYTIEEALTNARKHAKATHLWIRLYRRGSSIVAEVEDDGLGFDVAAVEEKYAERSSLGMMNLRERSSLVGGKTVIQSAPGKGTKVSVTLPIRGKAAYQQ